MVDISDNTKWSQTDASNNTTSPTGWTTGTMLPSQVEPTARAMMGALKRWYDHSNATVASGGAANVQTLTYSVAPAAYVTGDCYNFRAGFTNTASATLNVNGLGAKTIKRNGTALTGQEIQAGAVTLVCYDGTNMQLVAVSGGDVVSSTVAVGSAVALTTLTAKTVTSISVPAGNWLIWASGGFTGGGTTTVDTVACSISSADNALDQTAGRQAVQITASVPLFSVWPNFQMAGPVTRISIAATTTIYLVELASFATSTCSGWGAITAVREAI